MDSFRKWFYKPKKDDPSLLAQFFYADEALNMIATELDSFDGRKDPERCTNLVNHLRQAQDKVLGICHQIMNELIPGERASRDFRAKFPDDVMQDTLAGQLWFGAECLAAGSSIMNKENESAIMRPLAKALTKSLENVRNLLREQCLKGHYNTIVGEAHAEKLYDALKVFDHLFARFELIYVSAMVPVKSPREYELQQLVIVLFSETLQRALKMNLLTQEMVDDYEPALMFTIPRLAIVGGLLIFPDGPLCPDNPIESMSEMFRPFRTLLQKIRELLLTLNSKELYTLEKLLCSSEEPSDYRNGLLNNSRIKADSDFGIVSSDTPEIFDADRFVTRLYVDYSDCKQIVSNFYSAGEDKNVDSDDESVVLEESSERKTGSNVQSVCETNIPGDGSGSNQLENCIDGLVECSSSTRDAEIHPKRNDSCDISDNCDISLPGRARNIVPSHCVSLLLTMSASDSVVRSKGDGAVNPANIPSIECDVFTEEIKETTECNSSERTCNIESEVTDASVTDENHPDFQTFDRNLLQSISCRTNCGNSSADNSGNDDDAKINLNSDCGSIVTSDSIDSVACVKSSHCSKNICKPVQCVDNIADENINASMLAISEKIVNFESQHCSRTVLNSVELPESDQCDSYEQQNNLVENQTTSLHSNFVNCSEPPAVKSIPCLSDFSAPASNPEEESHSHRKSQQNDLDLSRASEIVVGSCSSTCSSCRSSLCITSDSCSTSSDTSSFNSECQDDGEIALAMRAAEITNRNVTRSKFRSSEDLIHRLFVCIAGVADQLQTNFAGDLRNILKCVFLMSASSSTASPDEEVETEESHSDSNSRTIDNAEEALLVGWEHTHMSRVPSSPPPWIPDEMAPRCMSCKAIFTVVRRRHHCRNCGKVFCARCSSNSVPLPRFGHVKPVRVCNRCFLYQVTPFTLEELATRS